MTIYLRGDARATALAICLALSWITGRTLALGSPLVTRTVILCANFTPELKAAFPELPAHALIEKPFDMAAVTTALERLASPSK